MAETLISVLLEQLATVVYQHTNEAVKLVLNAQKDVKSFSSKLKAIQAVLEDAEKKQVMDAGVADWLDKLKDVSYEMDDVLDEWNTELLRQQVEEKLKGERDNTPLVTKKKVCFPMPSGCFCFGKVNKVILNHNIAKRIKELDEKLTLIANEREMYGLRASRVVGPDYQQVIHRLNTSSLVDISKIFGRDEETENLLRKLLRESSQKEGRFLVIPIVGMGGMGKTTFAQLAYNNEKVNAHFDKKVWVCVSDLFDEIKIAKMIIEGLGGGQSSSNELETLLTCISSQVENKKFFLVLDDVWTEDPKNWESLKLAEIMQTCAAGSTILVTTRNEGVARMMKATSSMIHLDKLSDRDSLALLNSIALSDTKEGDDSSEFGVIGVEIVKKCKGLPLAIKTLGILLRSKKTREWLKVLNSEIWESEEFEENVFKPLLLSYYDLTPAVRRCLLYCVVFPKDYELEKNKLIELWMSQDYLTLKKNKKKREIGQNYFESLAIRSFFQDFSKDEFGNVYGCKMNDIVHDFVQFQSKREREYITIDVVEGGSVQVDNKVRHLTLTSVQGPLSFPTSFYTQNKVRSLTLLDSNITAISFGTILQMKCLRTLNLSDSKLKKLPTEIGELIHLRYMNLSSSWLHELPEAVCDLLNLQTLDVRGCRDLEKLPKGMGKLINLKHLYVIGCILMKVLPEAVCDLLNLQTLDVRECRSLEKLPKGMRKLINLKHLYVEGCPLKYLPKGIGSLKSLQVLDGVIVREGEDEALKLGDLGSMDQVQLQGRLEIRGLGNKDDVSAIEKVQLGNKEHLLELVVDFKFNYEDEEAEQREVGDSEIVKALRPHQNLESLSIIDSHGTTESLYWISSSFHNLRKVQLDGWKFCQVLPPLGKLPSLEVLEISFMKKVKKVGVEFLGSEEGIVFPKLKRLCFYEMPNWEEWEGITMDSSEITIMPHLSSLVFRYCPKLKALHDFLYKIIELRTLEIYGCPILEGEYKEGVGKEWHNISHIPNLTIQSW